MSDLETKIRELLKGIDEDECRSADGWWETSTGVKFGTKKLAALLALVRDAESDARQSALEEAARICESFDESFSNGEAAECAGAIRSLANQVEPEGEQT